ncbi:hypothetical protein C2E23DRAFT_884085 [Lenzites betulinus]|nr:hypothetical protein C2E23DRAFT_884085 [Lenzites betulinus]
MSTQSAILRVQVRLATSSHPAPPGARHAIYVTSLAATDIVKVGRVVQLYAEVTDSTGTAAAVYGAQPEDTEHEPEPRRFAPLPVVGPVVGVRKKEKRGVEFIVRNTLEALALEREREGKGFGPEGARKAGAGSRVGGPGAPPALLGQRGPRVEEPQPKKKRVKPTPFGPGELEANGDYHAPLVAALRVTTTTAAGAWGAKGEEGGVDRDLFSVAKVVAVM